MQLILHPGSHEAAFSPGAWVRTQVLLAEFWSSKLWNGGPQFLEATCYSCRVAP